MNQQKISSRGVAQVSLAAVAMALIMVVTWGRVEANNGPVYVHGTNFCLEGHGQVVGGGPAIYNVVGNTAALY
jgi:hypothetical protein